MGILNVQINGYLRREGSRDGVCVCVRERERERQRERQTDRQTDRQRQRLQNGVLRKIINKQPVLKDLQHNYHEIKKEKTKKKKEKTL